MSSGRTSAKWLGVVISFCILNVAHSEIVLLAPPVTLVPEGAWVANTPGISYGNSAAGYALQRSQAWRMQNNHSTPSAKNYWLVLPGATGHHNYGQYGIYGYSAGPYSQVQNARVANTRSHVARANAYRMNLFER